MAHDDDVQLPRELALDILAALHRAAEIASAIGDLSAEIEFTEAHTELSLEIFPELPED